MENYEQDMTDMNVSRERRLDREAIVAAIKDSKLTDDRIYEVVDAVYQKYQPHAQLDVALDDREHRALVMVLRALRRAWERKNIAPGDDEIRDALTIARFVWPDAFAEATRDEEGGG